jgi:hypothetical protein
MLYFAVHMAMYMLPFFPRSIELRSQRMERQPIPLWPEDYEEGMAILMHIVTENRIGYLNRFIRKGGGRRTNGRLAGYLDAVPKRLRISVTPEKSSACHLRWIELSSRTFVSKTTIERGVVDRIVTLDPDDELEPVVSGYNRRHLGTRFISISSSAHYYLELQPIFTDA